MTVREYLKVRPTDQGEHWYVRPEDSTWWELDYSYSDLPTIEDGPLEKRRARWHIFSIKHPKWSVFSDSYIHRYGSGPGSRTNPSAARIYVEYLSQHADFVTPGTAKSAKWFASHIWDPNTHESALRFFLSLTPIKPDLKIQKFSLTVRP